jgi:hypothetical protein
MSQKSIVGDLINFRGLVFAPLQAAIRTGELTGCYSGGRRSVGRMN